MKAIFSIGFLLFIISCSDRPRLAEPARLAEETSSFSIAVENNSAPADNYSYITITLKTLMPGSFDPASGVTFTIDKGSFAQGGNILKTGFGTDSTATVQIRSAEEGVVHITALIGANYISKANVLFTKALPTVIQVEPDSATLKSLYSSSTKVTAKLLRYPGTVSANQQVFFTDSTAGGQQVGTFFNITRSDINGIATATYKLQDTSYHGFVYIKCRVQTDSADIAGRNRILIF